MPSLSAARRFAHLRTPSRAQIACYRQPQRKCDCRLQPSPCSVSFGACRVLDNGRSNRVFARARAPPYRFARSTTRPRHLPSSEANTCWQARLKFAPLGQRDLRFFVLFSLLRKSTNRPAVEATKTKPRAENTRARADATLPSHPPPIDVETAARRSSSPPPLVAARRSPSWYRRSHEAAKSCFFGSTAFGRRRHPRARRRRLSMSAAAAINLDSTSARRCARLPVNATWRLLDRLLLLVCAFSMQILRSNKRRTLKITSRRSAQTRDGRKKNGSGGGSGGEERESHVT